MRGGIFPIDFMIEHEPIAGVKLASWEREPPQCMTQFGGLVDSTLLPNALNWEAKVASDGTLESAGASGQGNPDRTTALAS